MLRIFLGVAAGFIAWLMAWFGGEAILSALWPEGFGLQQRAFEAALVDGGPFTADTTFLLTHIVLGSAVSMMAGYLAALVSAESRRAPLVLAVLLLALGLLKAAMSWTYVPLWYHVLFTALLFSMTIIGGRLMRRFGGRAGNG